MKKFLLAIAAFAFVAASCSKTEPTPTPTPDPQEHSDVLFVPYFDSQLKHMSMEFTVTKPDGSTEIIKLDQSTATDSPEYDASKKQNLQDLAAVHDITETVHVFKVYGGTSTAKGSHKIGVKVKPTGTYSDTEKANFAFGALMTMKETRSIFTVTATENKIKTLCDTYSTPELCVW